MGETHLETSRQRFKCPIEPTYFRNVVTTAGQWHIESLCLFQAQLGQQVPTRTRRRHGHGPWKSWKYKMLQINPCEISRFMLRFMMHGISIATLYAYYRKSFLSCYISFEDEAPACQSFREGFGQ